MTIDPSVTKIAVVDRVSNEFTKGAVQGFLEQSQEVDLVRFQVVSAQQIYNDLAVPVNGPGTSTFDDKLKYVTGLRCKLTVSSSFVEAVEKICCL